jgi:altronate hydrolase
MQEAGDLSLQLGHFRKVDERRRAFEELPLNFGRESAPSHDDGCSQTFNNLLFFGEKLIRRIKWWEEYTARNGNEMNNNPSPGNKAGGLTTILEKSLGAVAKGGTTNLVDVYEYAQPVTAKGFVYMDTPGYDPVSATGQVAGGANMICFTTGRGSAYGCKPSPSLKLATNTPLFVRQEDDMDINCGTVIEGKESIEAVGARFFELILATASGEKSKSEQWGYGEDEFAPWMLGATM